MVGFIGVMLGGKMLQFIQRIFLSVACWMFWMSSYGAADPVTLTLPDGDFSVSGEFVAFDGSFYKIDTEFGLLTMASDTVICTGLPCPLIEDIIQRVVFSGDKVLGQVLLLPLIKRFANTQGYNIESFTLENSAEELHFRKPEYKQAMAVFRMSFNSTSEGILEITDGNADFSIARRAVTDLEQNLLNANFGTNSTAVRRSKVIGWESLQIRAEKNNEVSLITTESLISMTSGSPALWPLKNGVQLPVFIDGLDESMMALRQQLGQPTTAKIERPQGVNAPGILSVSHFWQGAKNGIKVVTSCEEVSSQPVEKKGAATPLRVPMYLIASPKKLAPIARDFWAFLMSLEAQKLVQDLGFESRTPIEVKFDGSAGIILKSVLNTDADMRADDLRNAIQRLLGYSRLSVSFRFLEGSQILDEPSQSNLGYLVNLLLSGQYGGREVIFAGFTDSQGSSDGNLQISLDRARAVRATINTMLAEKNVGQLQFKAIGLGEGLPIVCNNSDWGQYQNRRVEVWLK